MRVLILHNLYQLAGGEDAVVKAEQELLEERGHPVKVLLADNKSINTLRGRATAAAGVVYSFSARRRVAEAIAEFAPDVVHVHNFFPLWSPSIYDACRAAAIPVVQTLHNYRLACPGALFFRDGRVCEECLGRSFPWPSVLHGCYRSSRMQSAATATMLGVHRVVGTWHQKVNAFIALTSFQRAKLEQAGLPGAKIHVKPNFVPDPGVKGRLEASPYALYVGRISEEKGIAVVVDAYIRYSLNVPLKVVGEGPALDSLRARVIEAGLERTIEFLGRRERSEIDLLMRGARFLVFPSVWYEGFPMTIAEAFASGLPVMASNIGGLPEIIENGVSGWSVSAGDAEAWGAAIATAWADPREAAYRGLAARHGYERFYSPDANLTQLIGIYESVIKR